MVNLSNPLQLVSYYKGAIDATARLGITYAHVSKI